MLNYTYISLAQMKDVIVCDEGKEETCTKINIFVGYFWKIDSQIPIKINTKNNLLIKL